MVAMLALTSVEGFASSLGCGLVPGDLDAPSTTSRKFLNVGSPMQSDWLLHTQNNGVPLTGSGSWPASSSGSGPLWHWAWVPPDPRVKGQAAGGPLLPVLPLIQWVPDTSCTCPGVHQRTPVPCAHVQAGVPPSS